jgi:hypothetical protein
MSKFCNGNWFAVFLCELDGSVEVLELDEYGLVFCISRNLPDLNGALCVLLEGNPRMVTGGHVPGAVD